MSPCEGVSTKDGLPGQRVGAAHGRYKERRTGRAALRVTTGYLVRRACAYGSIKASTGEVHELAVMSPITRYGDTAAVAVSRASYWILGAGFDAGSTED